MARASQTPMMLTRTAGPARTMPRPAIIPPPTGAGANSQTVTSLGLKDALLGAIVGFGTGGPAGAVAGAAAGLLGPGDNEQSGSPTVPGRLTQSGPCPGIGSVFINGRCVNLGDLGPGGPPAITPAQNAAPSGIPFSAVQGRYGFGATPTTETRQVRMCPTGMVLGNDGVCYERSQLPKSRREWNPGMKPLMTGGDRKAIRRAESVANALMREQKRVKKTAKALAKIG